MASGVKKKEKSNLRESTTAYQVKNDACVQTRSVLREIGNSKGVILSKKVIDAAGIPGNNVLVEASKGEIRIRAIDDQLVNTDLSSWGKQFKDALKAGQEPEQDLFDHLKNKFDEEEW